jgi:hypothetical protein
MRKTFLTLIIGSVIAITTLPQTFGEEKRTYFNEIISLKKKSNSLTVYEGPNKNSVYTTNAETNIFLDGKRVELSDLKPKMKAIVDHKKDSTVADAIHAQSLAKKKGKKGKS